MGFAWLESLSEDFPDHPARVEFIWSVAGFFMGFPFLFATRFDVPFGVSHTPYIFVGVAIDGLFWAFASVSVYRLSRWVFARRQFFR